MATSEVGGEPRDASESPLNDVHADLAAAARVENTNGTSIVERLMGLDAYSRSLETGGADFAREIGLAVQAFRSAGAPSDAGLQLVEDYVGQVEALVAGAHEHERGTERRAEVERDAVETLARTTRRLLRGLLSLQVDDKPDLPGEVTLVPRDQVASLTVRFAPAERPSLPELTRVLSALDILFHGTGSSRTVLTHVSDEDFEAVVRADFPDRPARLGAEDVARGLVDMLFDAVRGVGLEAQAADPTADDRPEAVAMRRSLMERTAKELLGSLQRAKGFRLCFEGAGQVALVSEDDRLTLADGNEVVRESPLRTPSL